MVLNSRLCKVNLRLNFQIILEFLFSQLETKIFFVAKKYCQILSRDELIMVRQCFMVIQVFQILDIGYMHTKKIQILSHRPTSNLFRCLLDNDKSSLKVKEKLKTQNCFIQFLFNLFFRKKDVILNR